MMKSPVSFRNFQCRQCGECCKGKGTVQLSSQELEDICRYLAISHRLAMRYYCYRDKKKYVLFDQPDESCIFLRQNRCLIHPVKPSQCRNFPHEWNEKKMLERCEGYQALTRPGDNSSLPGPENGENWSYVP